MKKLSVLLVLFLSVITTTFSIIYASANPEVNLNINIDTSDANTTIVEIPDDPNYADLAPEIGVNTTFTSLKVQKEKTGVLSDVEFELDGGICTFTIDDCNCRYIITNTGSKKSNYYKIPETGIE